MNDYSFSFNDNSENKFNSIIGGSINDSQQSYSDKGNNNDQQQLINSIINGNHYIGDFNESKEINGNQNMVTEIGGKEAFFDPIWFEALNDLKEPPKPENNEVIQENSLLNKKRSNKDELYFNDEEVRRQSKKILYDSLRCYINDIIKVIYKNNIGYGINIKKIYDINGKEKKNVKVDNNKELLTKSIGDIFSVNISKKCTSQDQEHNKRIIEMLMNDQDNDKREFFTNLFNIKLENVLKHIRRIEIIKELDGKNGVEGLNKYISLNSDNFYKKRKKDVDDYKKTLEDNVNNYDSKLGGKKSRKTKNKKIDKKNHCQ